MQRIVWVLQSRKLWASVIGILSAVGILDLSDPTQAESAAYIAAGVTALYGLAVAIEDGLSKRESSRD